jgi:hypothetical protein
MLRELVRCGICQRKMQDATICGGLFLGAAASKILRHAPVPVMILPR